MRVALIPFAVLFVRSSSFLWFCSASFGSNKLPSSTNGGSSGGIPRGPSTSKVHAKASSTAAATPPSSAGPLAAQKVDFLHHTEYPQDDFSHILGVHDEAHVPSRLQQISAMRIAEVVRHKTPIDTDGCGIDRSFYISADDLRDDVVNFDNKYGPPINLLHQLTRRKPYLSPPSSSSSSSSQSRLQSTTPPSSEWTAATKTSAPLPKPFLSMAVAAEFKRASPSKGVINGDVDVVEQCMKYAQAGVSVISVLTEFPHFKGTLQDMRRARFATQAWAKETKSPNGRPAILRKDFIFDRYQILEARANGADTVLLIVAVLGVAQLWDLIYFSRQQGMEPLVEVHTDREMEIALDNGARVIGVNNRNLHNFQLDLDTTKRILKVAEARGVSWRWDGTESDTETEILTRKPPSSLEKGHKPDRICVAALSGISCAEDVAEFDRLGVRCCLVGETLMKSPDPMSTLAELFPHLCSHSHTRSLSPTLPTPPSDTTSVGGIGELPAHTTTTNSTSANHQPPRKPSSTTATMTTRGTTTTKSNRPLAKICGLTSTEDARIALQCGANFLGMIFVPGAKREVDRAVAREIVQSVRAYGERRERVDLAAELRVIEEQVFMKVGEIAGGKEKEGVIRGGVSGSNRSNSSALARQWFSQTAQLLRKITLRKPLVVGVFQNQSPEEINRIVEDTGVDLVQLHGDEPPEFATHISAPCINVLHLPAMLIDDSDNNKNNNNNHHADIVSLTEQKGGGVADPAAVGGAPAARRALIDAINQSAAGRAVAILLDTQVAPATTTASTTTATAPASTAGAFVKDKRGSNSSGGGGTGKRFDLNAVFGAHDAVASETAGSPIAAVDNPDVAENPFFEGPTAAVSVPVFIAGGLTPDNVAAVVENELVAPFLLGVDVSSGVEPDKNNNNNNSSSSSGILHEEAKGTEMEEDGALKVKAGKKDATKVKLFLARAKGTTL